eukprot:6189802-Pleurochrysis_carterae.AAC.3
MDGFRLTHRGFVQIDNVEASKPSLQPPSASPDRETPRVIACILTPFVCNPLLGTMHSLHSMGSLVSISMYNTRETPCTENRLLGHQLTAHTDGGPRKKNSKVPFCLGSLQSI